MTRLENIITTSESSDELEECFKPVPEADYLFNSGQRFATSLRTSSYRGSPFFACPYEYRHDPKNMWVAGETEEESRQKDEDVRKNPFRHFTYISIAPRGSNLLYIIPSAMTQNIAGEIIDFPTKEELADLVEKFGPTTHGLLNFVTDDFHIPKELADLCKEHKGKKVVVTSCGPYLKAILPFTVPDLTPVTHEHAVLNTNDFLETALPSIRTDISFPNHWFSHHENQAVVAQSGGRFYIFENSAWETPTLVTYFPDKTTWENIQSSAITVPAQEGTIMIPTDIPENELIRTRTPLWIELSQNHR